MNDTGTFSHEGNLIMYNIEEKLRYEEPAKDLALLIVSELNLKSAVIHHVHNKFIVNGLTHNNKILTINQTGEYFMYGNPYIPKMQKAEVYLNGNDILTEINLEFTKYGCKDKINDISRVDLWGSILYKK